MKGKTVLPNKVLKSRITIGQVNLTDMGEAIMKWMWNSRKKAIQEVRTFLTSLLFNFAHTKHVAEKDKIDSGYCFHAHWENERTESLFVSLLSEIWPIYLFLTTFIALSFPSHDLLQSKGLKEYESCYAYVY